MLWVNRLFAFTSSSRCYLLYYYRLLFSYFPSQCHSTFNVVFCSNNYLFFHAIIFCLFYCRITFCCRSILLVVLFLIVVVRFVAVCLSRCCRFIILIVVCVFLSIPSFFISMSFSCRFLLLVVSYVLSPTVCFLLLLSYSIQLYCNHSCRCSLNNCRLCFLLFLMLSPFGNLIVVYYAIVCLFFIIISYVVVVCSSHKLQCTFTFFLSRFLLCLHQFFCCHILWLLFVRLPFSN